LRPSTLDTFGAEIGWEGVVTIGTIGSFNLATLS
jgi:hypothetical protein